MVADSVRTGFRAFGVEHGLARRGNALYLRQSETVGVIDLQRSSWGPQFYVNVALWLLPLGDSETPPERLCHVRTRADSLIGDPRHGSDLLDLESDLRDEDREAELKEWLEGLLPVLHACSTIGGLRDSQLGRRLLGVALVAGEAQALLGGTE